MATGIHMVSPILIASADVCGTRNPGSISRDNLTRLFARNEIQATSAIAAIPREISPLLIVLLNFIYISCYLDEL